MHAIAGTHYIEIGGQKRPMRFGTNQTAKFCEVKKITLSEYSDMMKTGGLSDLGTTRDLLYSALWAGAKTEKLPTDFDEATVGDWMDEADMLQLMEQLSVAITGTANPNAKAQGKKK
jgi:hypothetical protein